MRHENLPYSPLSPVTIGYLKSTDVSVAQSESGKKFVLRANPCGISHEGKELYNTARREFTNLAEFGLNPVNSDMVILDVRQNKTDPSKPTLVTVANFVDGKPMLEAPDEVFKDTITSLTNYYEYKLYHTGEPFLLDITNVQQYVYGAINGGEAKMYLVDLDFKMNMTNLKDITHRAHVIAIRCEQILGLIKKGESAGMEMGGQFDQIRNFIEHVDIESVSPHGRMSFLNLQNRLCRA